MPGSVQSIERAAAVLRLLGGAGRPIGLAEIAAALDLPRPTAHGIVRTLREVGFVEQDTATSLYRLGAGLRELDHAVEDRHELRSRCMNWADALAGGSGLAVLVGVVDGSVVQVVHHVFRPDGSTQRLRVGSELPLHATALGKCLLAFAPITTPRPRELELERWTGRTCVTTAGLDEQLATARRRGYATEVGEYQPGNGAAAAPLRSSGGFVVGALGLSGPAEELFGNGGALRPVLADQLVGAAREISTALVTPS